MKTLLTVVLLWPFQCPAMTKAPDRPGPKEVVIMDDLDDDDDVKSWTPELKGFLQVFIAKD
jgi:hypothetical protein